MNYYCGVCQNGSANAAKTNGETRRNDDDGDGDAICEQLLRQAKCMCVCVRGKGVRACQRVRGERKNACACCLFLHFNFISFHFFCQLCPQICSIFCSIYLTVITKKSERERVRVARECVPENSPVDLSREKIENRADLFFFDSLIDWLIGILIDIAKCIFLELFLCISLGFLFKIAAACSKVYGI